MLDDASEAGLQIALQLLPPSMHGSGLLITSYLVDEEKCRAVLASTAANGDYVRRDGPAASVAVCECGDLDRVRAMQLFEWCGFALEPSSDPDVACINRIVEDEMEVCYVPPCDVMPAQQLSGMSSSCD